MMTPTIRVDDDVFALLQREARAFVDTPNSVLRKLLGLEEVVAGSTASPPPPAVPGKVLTLLQEGHVEHQEPLIWPRRQNGQTFRASVTDAGRIRLEDGREFDTPSGAARDLAGYEVNGLRAWRRESDGATLGELWARRQSAIKRRIERNHENMQEVTEGVTPQGARP